jgi:aminopeptidase
MNLDEFEHYLDKYADLVVKVGMNLQSGQQLIIRAPIESAPLVRAVTESAYRNGSPLVDVFWTDDQMNLIRFKHAPRDSFENYPTWRTNRVYEHVQEGGALFSILAEDPVLLNGQNPDLIAIARKTAAYHNQPVRLLLAKNSFNWVIVSYPIPNWATAVYPELPAEQAVDQLWESLFKVCRLDQNDPVAVWQAHISDLKARCAYLNVKQYDRLVFTGPGTNLTVGLAHGHRWEGGQSKTQSGIAFTPNLPTEEIFTTPHRENVEGVVSSTKPRSLSGNMIEDFSFTFKKGRIVASQAAKGDQILKDLIETDEGSARLGEVALVPHSSPVAQSNLLFNNPLLDENAASHIALGNAYKFCLHDGETLSESDFLARGGNISLIHEDLMIGSSEIDVDGVYKDGAVEPVMRSGEWAFSV